VWDQIGKSQYSVMRMLRSRRQHVLDLAQIAFELRS